MVQIKGSSVQETINQIKRRAGDEAFGKILGFLDTDARKLFEGEIFASSWYSLDCFCRFLEVEIKVLANGNEEMITRGSEAVAERQLRGIYKAFVKLGSPEFVIKRVAAVHATYFQGVPIQVELPAPGIAKVTYKGFAQQHRLMGFAIIGFFRKALEIIKAARCNSLISLDSFRALMP
jgi:hypothetical protein